MNKKRVNDGSSTYFIVHIIYFLLDVFLRLLTVAVNVLHLACNSPSSGYKVGIYLNEIQAIVIILFEGRFVSRKENRDGFPTQSAVNR